MVVQLLQRSLILPWAEFYGRLNHPNSSRIISFTLVHHWWALYKVKEPVTCPLYHWAFTCLYIVASDTYGQLVFGGWQCTPCPGNHVHKLRGMLKQQQGITMTVIEEGMALSIILLFHKPSIPQNGKMGEMNMCRGEERCSTVSMASLPALPSPEDGVAMALLLPMMGRLVSSPTGLQCFCLSLPFPPAVAARSHWIWKSPVLAHPLALPLPFLWQEQLTYRPRWQNSVFPPLSLPCTSLFGSIFLSLNFM